MAKKAPRGIHIACQRIFRNAIVNSSILTILVKQGRQRWCMFLAPWRQWHAQNTQCTGPRVECIASAVTATPRTCSSQEPGARIGMKKSLYSNHRQLFRLEESSLFAVLSESPDPVKVIYDRSRERWPFRHTSIISPSRASFICTWSFTNSWTNSRRKSLIHYHDNRTSFSRSGGLP